MKILIIEDDRELTKSMSRYLRAEAYICEIAADFRSALEKIASFDYDCILLDISNAAGNGLKFLQRLQISNKSQDVIIISDENSAIDQPTSLKFGVDDYLIKPFRLPELTSRISAAIQRGRFGGHSVLKINELTINITAKRITVHDKAVNLTRKEYDLLLYFVSNKDHVISKNSIARHITNSETDVFDNFDFIYTHIKNLKRKLQQAGADDYIQSVYGMGYKFST